MKNIGKTFLIYLAAIIIIGIVLGLTGIAGIHDPLRGFGYALGYSIRIFYVTIPLLVAVYLVIHKQAQNKKEAKNS